MRENIIRNPGAETGDMTDWIVPVSNSWVVDLVNLTPLNGCSSFMGQPRSGSHFFGECPANPTMMYQIIYLTIGEIYSVSLWAANPQGNAKSIKLSIGNNVLIYKTSIPKIYTQYTTTFTATNAVEILQIIGTAPEPGSVNIDDISVVSLAPTTIPTAIPTFQPSSIISIRNSLVVYIPVEDDIINKSDTDLTVVNYGARLTSDRNDKNNQAFLLDGNSKVEIQYKSALDSGIKEVTMSAWVKFDTIADDQRIIDIGSSYCSEHPGAMIRTAGNQFLHEKTCIGGACEISNLSNTIIEINKWYHIVSVTNGQTAKLYINGVLDHEINDPRPGCDLSSYHSIFLGYNQYLNGEFLKGALDEIAIWHRSLSENEIRGLFDGIIDIHAFSNLSPTIIPTISPSHDNCQKTSFLPTIQYSNIPSPVSSVNNIKDLIFSAICPRGNLIKEPVSLDQNGDIRNDWICEYADGTIDVCYSNGSTTLSCVGLTTLHNNIN